MGPPVTTDVTGQVKVKLFDPICRSDCSTSLRSLTVIDNNLTLAGTGGGGVSQPPKVFSQIAKKTAARSAAVFCTPWASLAQLLVKKNWSGHVRPRSYDVILEGMFGARAWICDVSCLLGHIFAHYHSNHVRIVAYQANGGDPGTFWFPWPSFEVTAFVLLIT